MAEITIKATVDFTNSFKKFEEDMELAAELAMREMAEDGAEKAAELAPQGHKPDKRTPPIINTIYDSATKNTATWGAWARHAYVQEVGGKPHPITGWVKFYWEKERRDWKPGPNIINHPGNPPHPFLGPSLDYIFEKYGEYLNRNYRKIRP